MRLTVLMPVLNERATVREILDQVISFSMPGVDKEIIVIEGRSTDGTREIVRSYEGRPGLSVVYEERPQGKGAAVREGLRRATGDVLMIQDGDLEYRVSDYPKVLAPFLNGGAEIVFGSRVTQHERRWQFRQFSGPEAVYGLFMNLGGVLFTGLFNALYRTRLTDGATMFKVFRADLLKGIELKSDGFDFDWEIQGKLAKRGCRFLEVPVFYQARSRAEGKTIRLWRDGWRVLKAIVRFRFSD